MSAPATRNLAILLTDIKGFTDKTSSRSRADIQRLLDEHRDVVLPVLQEKGGRLIKTIGDAFLMVFESPTDAVLAGVAAQAALAKRNAPLPESERIEIRIAINSGEVNLMEGDVYGEPVNIAARIEGVAEAGEVYFTEAVYLSMNKIEVPSAEIGLLQLKGIPEKIRVYKVRHETPLGVGQVPPSPPPRAAAGPFAPGEKARVVSLAGAAPAAPSAAPSAPAAKPPLPSTWRRAGALAIDALLCSLILGFFTGARTGVVHLTKKPGTAAPKVTSDAKGTTIEGDGGKVRFDDTGVHGGNGDVKVALDATGLHVVPVNAGKPPVAVWDNGKGAKITVDDPDEDSGRPRARSWGFALVWAVYGVVFLKWFGATPGKKILKLKVVSTEGPELTKRQRWLRPVFSLVSGYAAFLGYLWALWDPQRRGWHDHVAGTRVVPAE
jgi:class 3 adenylate cyclase